MRLSIKYCSRVAWLIIILLVAGWWYVSQRTTPVVHGTILEKPKSAPLFSLTGMDGRAFDTQSLHGHWTMLFFGFTHCDSVCPARLMDLSKMIRILEHKHISVLPHVVMISLDPERDDLVRLKDYVQAFNPDFYAATGSSNSLKALQHVWGISSDTIMRRKSDGTLMRDIEHSSTVMVFNPQGALAAFLTSTALAEQLASDFLIISTTRNQ